MNNPTSKSAGFIAIKKNESKSLLISFWVLIFIFLVNSNLFGQTYETTGASTDWEDPNAWTCTGGPCGNNPFPSNMLTNDNVIIQHNINYTGNSQITINNNSSIDISQGAVLNLSSNLNNNSGGDLIINNGTIVIGPGIMNNDGTVDLTNALVQKDGNYINNGNTTVDNSCIELLDGNFNNNETLEGLGSVKTQNGNINNNGTWSLDVEFCASNNSSNVPIQEDCEAADEICNCVLSNCDILPGYNPTTKVDDIIGSELIALAQTYDPNGPPPSEAIYTINNDEVLIEIVVVDGKYNDVVNYLGNLGIDPSDFFDDMINPVDDELLITVFFPINELLDLNQQTTIVNFARPVTQGISSSGLITSQGDFAQGSFIGRQGWNLTGEGIKIGVISNSYGTDASSRDNDINNGDLPGAGDPVVVVQEYPFGLASDEGRAMLQILHDVAPDAQLFFHTGFISEGNLAAGIRKLYEDAQCDIIVDDVQYITEPFFQDGLAAQSIDEVTSNGVSYFSAAGNFSSRSFSADFSPASAPNDNRHDFGGGDFLQSVQLGIGKYLIVLQWEDDFYSLGAPQGALNDIDIYLAGNDGSILYGFNRDNNGDTALGILGGDPIEIMPFTVINPTTTNIMIELADGSGPLPKFKYVVFRAGDDGTFIADPPLGNTTDNSTIVGHANATGAITLGAVRYGNTPAFGGTLETESFSSAGGTPIQGENQLREKPDFMAPNGVNTSVDFNSLDIEGDNIPNFFGTSAAAPHAAGVAALLMDAQNSFEINPPINVRELLRSTAIDMESPGFDYISGYGFISTSEALGSIANPTPNLIQLNLDNLDTDLYEPGNIEFTLIIEGEFLDQTTVAFFRGEELETTILNDSTANVIIPPFMGNPPIWVFTPPGPLTNGTDGGTSNTLTFLDPVLTEVIIEVDASSKRYGEPLPTFSFTTKAGEAETPLPQDELDLLTPSVSYTTAANTTSNVGIYAVNADTSNIAIELKELYNFTLQPGALIVDPMPVTIKPISPDPITYGDPIPEITFEYIYGEEGEENVIVDETVADAIALQHTDALALANGLVLVNGLPLVNGLVLVNGEPYIDGSDDQIDNGVSLNNKTFYVSESTLDAASTSLASGLPLVNGDGTEKIVQLGADLFTVPGIEDGDLSTITNGLVLVNGLPLVNGLVLVNGLPLVNGVSLVNGLVLVNGLPLVNGLVLVNGEPFDLVNGLPLVNSNGEFDPVFESFNNVLAILNESDPDLSIPVDIKPINVITGLDVGTQYIVPGGFINNNLVLSYKPSPMVIEPAQLTVTVNDATITYGEQGPFDFSVGYDPEESLFPYGDTAEEVFGTFQFTPDDGCASQTEIAVSPQPDPDNYDVTYVPGNLTFAPTTLTIEAGTDFIFDGDLLPENFNVNFDGLVCGDVEPPSANISYEFLDGNSNPAADPPIPGLYEVIPIFSDPNNDYPNYVTNSLPGNLYVNPLVGCNNRIKASDICQEPATLPGEPQITTLLRFEYTNDLSVPIYIPLGPKNKFKGNNTYHVGDPPVVFEPGIYTFDIYTDGGNLQWEVKTDNCGSASKSANGSNADPCNNNQGMALLNQNDIAEENYHSILLQEEDWQVKLFPNPTTSSVWLQTQNMDGQVTIEIFNSIGQVMLNRSYEIVEYEKINLDISEYTSGLLLVKILYNDNSKILKLIKN